MRVHDACHVHLLGRGCDHRSRAAGKKGEGKVDVDTMGMEGVRICGMGFWDLGFGYG